MLTKAVATSRNALCPCGSGKKFKHCCLSEAREFNPTEIDSIRSPSPMTQILVNRIASIRRSSRTASPLPRTLHSTEVLEQRRSHWREIVLVMEKPDGGRVDIRLLRPVQWMEVQGAEVGSDIFLDLAEMGARGYARVLAIHPCPRLEAERGRDRSQLVTGTFAHSSGEVYDLKLASEVDAIGVTGSHPFWSCERMAWVSVKHLRIGETLKTLEGTTFVESITKRSLPEPVFNVEVEGDHVYRVGESGVLVHNQSHPDDFECEVNGSAVSVREKCGQSYLDGTYDSSTNELYIDNYEAVPQGQGKGGILISLVIDCAPGPVECVRAELGGVNLSEYQSTGDANKTPLCKQLRDAGYSPCEVEEGTEPPIIKACQ